MDYKTISEKRIEGELKIIKKIKENYYEVIQDENNKYIFYFLFVGEGKPYEGGYYLGKIILPVDYPKKPGDIIVLTPSGRFNINKKICLSNTGFHLESHTPIWTIEQIIIGFISIFYDKKENGIGHLHYTDNVVEEYTEKSFDYNMKYHKDLMMKFTRFVNEDGKPRTKKEINEIIEEYKDKQKKKKEKKMKKNKKDKQKKKDKLFKD